MKWHDKLAELNDCTSPLGMSDLDFLSDLTELHALDPTCTPGPAWLNRLHAIYVEAFSITDESLAEYGT